MRLGFVAERAVSRLDGETRFVVTDVSYRLHPESSAYLAALRSMDRSPNTERVYAGRIALFLTYCSTHSIDWKQIDISDLTRFLRWLTTEPIPPRSSRSTSRYRSPQTANAVMTTVCEFLRFGASYGWVSPDLVRRLSRRRDLRYLPGYDGGESNQLATDRGRTLKLSAPTSETAWLTNDQVDTLITASKPGRDRLLVTLLGATGVRIGEALGLRRQDMHLLASGSTGCCPITGPHIHIRRRRNANGATAKSRYPRSIPVLDNIAELYADYLHERFGVPGASESDFVFVNLYREPIGEGMRYDNAKAMFDRLSKAVGFTARPHMLRHTAATRWIERGVPRDVVQHLLGHASPSSMERYLHPTDEVKRAAIEMVASGMEPT